MTTPAALPNTRRSRRRGVFVAAALVALCASTSSATTGRAQTQQVTGTARASSPPQRFAPPIVHYDVFGDSIPAGYGVAPRNTWVGVVNADLWISDPVTDHRFYNWAVPGQAIVTQSPIAQDASRAALLDHVRLFFAAPPDTTPNAERRVVLTPSVNELIFSGLPPDGGMRVAQAERGIRRAIQILLASGVERQHIFVLPTPQVGRQFAVEFDENSGVTMPLAFQIGLLNAQLRDVLSFPEFSGLDRNRDGYADADQLDGVYDPSTNRGPDGLHPDAEGHHTMAAAIVQLFTP